MKLGVSIEGEEVGLFAICEKTVKHLNAMEAATQRTNKAAGALAVHEKRLADLQAQSRRDAYNRLSVEEKITLLKQRQASLDAAASRAGAGTALARGIAIKQAMVASDLQALSSGAGGGLSGLRGILPLLGGGVAGTIGGAFLGGVAGGGIGMAVTGIIGALVRSAEKALEFADEVEDAAFQFRMTGEEMVRLRRAAAMSGVPSAGMMGALSRIESVRAAALGGDSKAMSLLRAYGVTESQVKGDASPFELMIAIQRSLGSGGMTSEDRGPLGQLFGRRPEKVIAALSSLPPAGSADDEERLKRLSEGQDFREKSYFEWDELWRRFWGNLAIIFSKNNPGPGAIGAAIRGERPSSEWMLNTPSGHSAPVIPRTVGKYTGFDSVDWNNTLSEWDQESQLADEWAAAGESKHRAGSAGPTRMGTADALARIGLFRGGASSTQRLMESQLQQLRQSVEQLRQINTRLSPESFQAF